MRRNVGFTADVIALPAIADPAPTQGILRLPMMSHCNVGAFDEDERPGASVQDDLRTCSEQADPLFTLAP